MKTSEILELIRAGYTKEEITTLDNDTDAEKNEHPEPKPESTPKPEPEQESKPESVSEPKAEPKPAKIESETDKLVKALGLKLDALTSAIQTSNVNKMEQGGNNLLTTEDVLATIIDPNYKGGN